MIFHRFDRGLPQSAEVWSIRGNEFPRRILIAQKSIDVALELLIVKAFIELLEFTTGTYKGGAIVGVYNHWFASTGSESFQSADESVGSKISYQLKMDCLCSEAYEHCYVGLDDAGVTSLAFT